MKTASSFLATLVSREDPMSEVVLPDGIKITKQRNHSMIWVHETPPRVHSLKWIAEDSPVRYGKETKYQTVKIALPYVVVIAVFGPCPRGGLTLSNQFNECFFRNAPLADWRDELHYPALLNCSKFDPPEGRPLSWICTQHLKRRDFEGEKDSGRRQRQAFRALLHCLFETGFNYSSEHHEGASWFSESRGVDPRIASIEAWQEATKKDPLFVLDLPWLKTGHTLGQVVDRIHQNLGGVESRPITTAALARIVYNQQRKPKRRLFPFTDDL